MPRAKKTTTGVDIADVVENSNGIETDEVQDAKPARGTKRAAAVEGKSSRAKKIPQTNGENEIQKPATKETKEPKSRAKKQDNKNLVSDVKDEADVNQATSSMSRRKPIGRSKKKADDVTNNEAPEEESQVKTTKGRAKRGKTSAIDVSNKTNEMLEVPVARSTRSRTPNIEEETETVEPVTAAEAKKGRAKRTKAAAEETPVTTTTKEVKARGRQKKDDAGITETTAPKQRTKKDVKEVVVEEEKPKARSRAKKVATPEESNTETAADAASTSKRGKKAKASIENDVEKTVAKTKTPKQPEPESNEVDAAPKPATKGRGRKRAAPEEIAEESTTTSSTNGATIAKVKKPAALLNAVVTSYNKEDFAFPTLAAGDSNSFNLKISSWNVAGLRAWLKKDGLKFLEYEEPDIFCMQETKCSNDQLPEEVSRIPGYHPYWLCMPGGYAGVAIYSKIMPINVEYGIGNKTYDDVGRMITAEYEKFYLINVYVPNSGRKLVNLDSRMRWEKLFQEYVTKLDKLKPVLICGDMNVSHLEIDLANPKTNTRNAGFTKEERDKMTELLALGFVDTFRHLYPNRTGAYTFWTFMANARARNVGWRLDYFIISERMITRVVDNCIRSQCLGSDHCPITLFMKI